MLNVIESPTVKEAEIIAIIKNDNNTIANDFILDFKLRICLVDTIKDANIQNCVINIIGIVNSGVKAKNLISPGEEFYLDKE